MNFTSQICTTKDQSERLLALGLKRETADMHYYHTLDFENNEAWITSTIPYSNIIYNAEFVGELNVIENDIIPAWSFHRLLELCNVFYLGHRDYDSLINYLENLIKEGHFNKEYLEE